MKRLILFLTIFLLAACASQPENVVQLPTEFEIPTETASPEASPTDSPTPFAPESPTATLPVTLTETATALNLEASATLTVTPSLTITDTVTRTPSPTASETYAINLFDVLIATAENFTPMPTGYTVGGTPVQLQTSTGGQVVFPTLPDGSSGGVVATNCQYSPPGGFAAIYTPDLGCPIGVPPTVVTQASAVQNFERGVMVWVSTPFSHIYVLFNDGTYLRFDDLYNPTVDPESGGEIPPANLVEPVRGFGKIWRTVPGVREKLGWATQQELAASAYVLNFERGLMIDNSVRGDTLILVQQGGVIGGTWRAVAARY